MRKTIIAAMLASAATVTIRAFQNETGWKKDADGKLAVDSDGNPIYVNAGGAEQSVKGDTISNLNAEAKNHRTAKENAEATLNKYKGADGKLIDPETAVKAVDTISKIDLKKLIDAGEVDKVRDQISSEFKTQISEKDNALAERDRTIDNLSIDKAFDSSDFVRNNIAVPVDMFRDSFGKNVKRGADGKIEYYGRDGNRLLSKKHAGEYATGDEAFELMVEQHPQKATILKAPNHGGSGNNGNGGNRGNGRTMRRSEFEALPAMEQAGLAGAMGKGELTIVD